MNMELTASVSAIIISVVILLILIFLIVLILVIRKGGKGGATFTDGKRTISFNLESDGQQSDNIDSEEKESTSGRKKKRKCKETPVPVVPQQVQPLMESKTADDMNVMNNQSIQLINAKLTKTHNFFTHTAIQYTRTFHGFSLYNRVCSKNIKHDTPEVMEFKKLIAGKYLHECLFKYFCDMLEKWIISMEEECENRLKKDPTDDSIPTSYYSCLEPFMRYSEEATRMAKNITFTFAGKTIHGIPDEFVNVLNEMIMKNVNVVNSSLNIILYTVSDRWIEKVKEILDMYILVFGLILNDVDATLITVNGEMKAYVENLINT